MKHVSLQIKIPVAVKCMCFNYPRLVVRELNKINKAGYFIDAWNNSLGKSPF